MFYVFPRAVPKKECERLLKYCIKNTKFKSANVMNQGESDVIVDEAMLDDLGRNDPNIRKTDVAFITDKNNMVNEVAWHFLREANKIQFNYKLEYFQPVQFARYKNGGHYGWHQDSSGINPHGESRKLSLTFCLTDPNKYEGGKLEFFCADKALDDMELPNGTVIKGQQVLNDIRDQGSVIVFDSRDFHRVTPCTKGTRYSIVCWTVGPKFV